MTKIPISEFKKELEKRRMMPARKQLHEKKISELMSDENIIKEYKKKRLPIGFIGDEIDLYKNIFKQWAIAVVKKNREEIKGIIDTLKQIPFPTETQEERFNFEAFCWDKGQLARVNEFLIDRFEITEEDLK